MRHGEARVPGLRAGGLGGALLFALLALAAPGRADTGGKPADGGLTPVRLQLKWRHQFQFAGYYAAEAKGYFAREGLAVTFLESWPGLTPSEQLFTGAADMPWTPRPSCSCAMLASRSSPWRPSSSTRPRSS
jgi:ABC-type nitrate/sulfonate/bicarbonate transport system substrate-binding protein